MGAEEKKDERTHTHSTLTFTHSNTVSQALSNKESTGEFGNRNGLYVVLTYISKSLFYIIRFSSSVETKYCFHGNFREQFLGNKRY